MTTKKGKIIRVGQGFSVKAFGLFCWKIFEMETPIEIKLSDRWSWTRHDCCICGTNFKPYVPTGTLTIPGPPGNEDFADHYPICDGCIKTGCPELYHELLAQRAKFDAGLDQGGQETREDG